MQFMGEGKQAAMAGWKTLPLAFPLNQDLNGGQAKRDCTNLMKEYVGNVLGVGGLKGTCTISGSGGGVGGRGGVGAASGQANSTSGVKTDSAKPYGNTKIQRHFLEGDAASGMDEGVGHHEKKLCAG